LSEVKITGPTLGEADAGRHNAKDVTLALIRLAVTGRVVEAGGKYTLAPAGEDGPPEAA